MTFPNQKMIQIGKRPARNINNIYATANIQALNYAIGDLTGSGFKLWAYFNKNQDGYKFALSQKACELQCGIKRSSFYSAIKELLAKGYLQLASEGSNIYTFFELPMSAIQNLNNKQNSSFRKQTLDIENRSFPFENARYYSENQQRNNTYNTQISHDRTGETSFPAKGYGYDSLGF